MKRFYYTLSFSPYLNSVRAKNRKDAKTKIKKLWKEYKNIMKIVSMA